MTENKITGTLRISPTASVGVGSLSVQNNVVTGTLSADHVTYANGTRDYNALENKPALVYDTTRVELVGDVSMLDFGLREEALQPLTNSEIDNLFRY